MQLLALQFQLGNATAQIVPMPAPAPPSPATVPTDSVQKTSAGRFSTIVENAAYAKVETAKDATIQK